MAALQELDELAEAVRTIKDIYNVEWGDKSHEMAIDNELGIKGFDQLMDQVLILMECYRKFDQANPEPTIRDAKNARREALKAACEFLASIASNMITQAKERIRGARPISKELVVDIHSRVVGCDRAIKKARALWERDNQKGLDDLRQVIEEMDSLREQIELLQATAKEMEAKEVAKEERERRTVSLTKARVVAAWVSAVLGVLAFFMALASLLRGGHVGPGK